METLSQTELQEYDEILQQINNEHEKFENFKNSIERENNRIITKKLSESDGKFKISHVTIKIFNHLHEIFALYEQDIQHLDLQQFTNLENIKFGLIEIFITNSLLEKLSTAEWKIRTKVLYPQSTFCKISKLLHKTPILEIVPLETDLWEYSIHLSLIETSDFCSINLWKADIDISYCFQWNKYENCRNYNRDYLKISRLYSNDNQFDENLPQNQTQFYCNFKSKSDLIASIIKNCYHRLDLEMFAKFTKDNQNNVLEMHFYVDENKILLSYNCISKIMKIRCSLELLSKLKDYFLKSSEFDYERIRPKIQALFSKKSKLETMNMEQLLELYRDIRNVWL